MAQATKPKTESRVSLPKAPIFDSSDLSEALRRYDRTPFMDVLSVWMQCAPTPEDIAAFASNKPDLWVKAISDLAKISGYTEKQEVLHTMNVGQMSDSQLEDQARQVASALGLDITPRLLRSPTSGDTVGTPIPSENPASRRFNGKMIEGELDIVDVPSAPVRARRTSVSRKKSRS